MVELRKRIEILQIYNKLFLNLIVLVFSGGVNINGFELVTKSEWGGRFATNEVAFEKKVNYVIVHHSATPSCLNRKQCGSRMRSIQKYHMDERHWADIGYNFAIGSDGVVYEGRGARLVGAHAPGWNSRSYGIVFIGNYQSEDLNDSQVKAWQSLIKWLIDQGYLQSNYTLYAHTQVRETECPGDSLYNTLKSWPHWKLKAWYCSTNVIFPSVIVKAGNIICKYGRVNRGIRKPPILNWIGLQLSWMYAIYYINISSIFVENWIETIYFSSKFQKKAL